MNKARRELLSKAAVILSRLEDEFEAAKNLIEEAAADEQEAFNNLTEGLQQAERGQRMGEVAQNLQNIADEMSNCNFADWAMACEEACE